MMPGQTLPKGHAGQDIGSRKIVDFAAGPARFGGGGKPAGQVRRMNERLKSIVKRLVDALEAPQFRVVEIPGHHPGKTQN